MQPRTGDSPGPKRPSWVDSGRSASVLAATGHAIRDLVIDGACSFADLSTLRLSRFAGLVTDWREERGWTPLVA